jgi:AGCS family alanine or glycine:cation symporter
VVATFLGSITSLAFVWDLADAMNAMMAIPNLIALLALSGVIVAETNRYLWEDRVDETAPDKVPEIT